MITFFNRYLSGIQIAIILLLGIACYANSFNVPQQFDDISAVRIYNNINNDLYSLQGFFGKARWFADITFALNRYLHGEKVFGFHLLNLVIHLSSAGVIYLIVRRAIDALKRTLRVSEDDEYSAFLQRFVPFTAAALFVCHPVQTQAVTYIVQRYTSLATLLYLGSLLAYIQARLSYSDESNKLSFRAWGFACLFFALLAMKSKEIAFTLPLMIVALEAVLFKGQLLKNRFFLALGTALLLVIPLQQLFINSAGSPENLLQNMQLAATETEKISRIDYLLTQFRVVATYLRLLILPVNQNLDYDYPLYHSLFDPAVLAALLLHIALAGLAIALFIHSKRMFASATPSAGIPLRLACLGIFWFYLALSVESSLIPIRDVIFEHRIYLPSVGFFMAAACLAGSAAYKYRYQTALWAATALLCLVFTAGTIARNRIWSDELVMWQDVLEKSPNKARVRYNVGFIYYTKFKPEKALPYIVRAVEIDSTQERYWNTLNAAVSLLGRYEGRCTIGKEYHLVESEAKTPWLANSFNNLGLAYEYLGNLYLAQENYQKAVAGNPSLDIAWYNLALVAVRRNDTPTIASSLENLKAINPLLEQKVADTIRK
jgi:tetratricopeptide (TPR) repeat protein